MCCFPDIAELTDEEIARVNAAEDELGVLLVAYKAMPAYSSLSADELEELQSLESRLGVRLVAYD